MPSAEIPEIKPLPGKAEIDYRCFRAELLNVVTGSDGKKRSVTMNYRNLGTGQVFSNGYATTDTPGKYTCAGLPRGGVTNVTAVICGLDRLTDNIGPEAVQKLKEFLGVAVSNARGAVSETLK